MTEVNEHAMPCCASSPCCPPQPRVHAPLSDAAVADVALRSSCRRIALLMPTLPSRRVCASTSSNPARARHRRRAPRGTPRQRGGRAHTDGSPTSSSPTRRRQRMVRPAAGGARSGDVVAAARLGAGDMKRWSALRRARRRRLGRALVRRVRRAAAAARHSARGERFAVAHGGHRRVGDGNIDKGEFEAWIKGADGTLGGQVKDDVESGAAAARWWRRWPRARRELADRAGLLLQRRLRRATGRARCGRACSRRPSGTGSGLMLAAGDRTSSFSSTAMTTTHDRRPEPAAHYARLCCGRPGCATRP